MTACGQCHHLLTVGAIPVSDQREAKSRPKNIVDREVKGKLFVTSNELSVRLCGGLAVETPNLLVVKGNTILSARLSKDDGRVLISACIMDKSGGVIGTLIDNDWNMQPEAVWDFEAHPLNATIRTNHGQIAFAVDTRNDEVAMRGKWYFGGLPVEFSPTHANVMGNKVKVFAARYNLVFIAVA